MEAAKDTETLTGRVLKGTYRLGGQLGRGGMSTVYHAKHLRTGGEYAVKVLHPETARREGALTRFKREAEAIGALKHANVIAVHDFDVDGDLAFLAMDLLAGEDLSARIEREGAMPLLDAVRIFEQMAAGLGAAHARGLLHRDLKPANVFLATEEGSPERAILLDFGLAKSLGIAIDANTITQSGVVMGTPQYMSPEQAHGRPLDPRADLYALAAIFYEMLAGRPPLEAPTMPALFAKLVTDPPPPLSLFRPDLPPPLTDVLARGLAKEPAERYPNAGALVVAVRDAVGSGELPVTRYHAPASAPPPSYPSGPPPAHPPSGHPPSSHPSARPPSPPYSPPYSTPPTFQQAPYAPPHAHAPHGHGPPSQAAPEKRGVDWWATFMMVTALLLLGVTLLFGAIEIAMILEPQQTDDVESGWVCLAGTCGMCGLPGVAALAAALVRIFKS